MQTQTLEISREKLQAIAEFAQEVSERHKDKSSLIEAIESVVAYSTDTSKKDLQDAVNDLSAAERQELSAIIGLGKGEYTSYEAAYQQVGAAGEAALHYFEGSAEYIPAGVAAVEKEGITIN